MESDVKIIDIKHRLNKFSKKSEKTDCIEWIGGKAKGYGVLRIGKRGQTNYKMVLAHRLVYELKNGPIPSGGFICHSCDNPSCVNIDHLFLGTAKDNTRDMVNKRRNRIGEFSPKSKLSSCDVLSIINFKGRCEEACNKYKIGKSQFYRIKNRQTWEHLDREKQWEKMLKSI